MPALSPRGGQNFSSPDFLSPICRSPLVHCRERFRGQWHMLIFGELWNFLTFATIVMALSRKPVILAGPVQTGPARLTRQLLGVQWVR
ncbi:hypothetical protein PSAC2689_280008 [Paraburkholderia sacchari]